jgi:hypothetical protein
MRRSLGSPGSFLVAGGGWLLLSLLAIGCKQGVGDRCEQNSDCESNVCSFMGDPQNGTCCTLSNTSCGATLPVVDATPSGAGTDAAADAVDATSSSDATADQSLDLAPESLPPEAGVTPDAAADAAAEAGSPDAALEAGAD